MQEEAQTALAAKTAEARELEKVVANMTASTNALRTKVKEQGTP